MNTYKNIITVIPTRGLVYARTIESLKNNGIGGFLTISGYPLPESHNEAVRRTLTEYVEYVLFVEDDMELPPHTIERMLKANAPITAVEYPMDNGYSTVARQGNEVLWCGLGCTLIKQDIFRNIPDPWFETDHSYRINENPFSLEKIDNPNKYGGHDINFCLKCRNYGFKTVCIEGIEAKHLRNRGVERHDRTQDGRYEIYELPPISQRAVY